MYPNQGNSSSNWFLKTNNPTPGNDYISHNKTEYLTPGQKGFSEKNLSGWNLNPKENNFMNNWNIKQNFNNKNSFKVNNDGGFRSNTGQYNNSNENNSGPKFCNLKENSKLRYSYYNEDDFESIIKEQDEAFSRMSNVNENFKLEYIEYDSLPHISQLNLAVSK